MNLTRIKLSPETLMVMAQHLIKTSSPALSGVDSIRPDHPAFAEMLAGVALRAAVADYEFAPPADRCFVLLDISEFHPVDLTNGKVVTALYEDENEALVLSVGPVDVVDKIERLLNIDEATFYTVGDVVLSGPEDQCQAIVAAMEKTEQSDEEETTFFKILHMHLGANDDYNGVVVEEAEMRLSEYFDFDSHQYFNYNLAPGISADRQFFFFTSLRLGMFAYFTEVGLVHTINGFLKPGWGLNTLDSWRQDAYKWLKYQSEGGLTLVLTTGERARLGCATIGFYLERP